MSAASSFVTALSMALVSFVRCRFGAAFAARESLERRTAGNARLRHQNAVPADADIVAYLHQVVDLGALADHGVANGAAVDGGTGADFDIVLNDDAPDLRHLEVALSSHHEAEAVLTDLAARMNDDAIPEQRVGDHCPGAD